MKHHRYEHWFRWLRMQAQQHLFFVFKETWLSINRHQLMSLSASLSFYALFALIPLIVLIFFFLSHLVYSSDYAIVKLAILTGNLLPEFSESIMIEVFHATQTKAAWGAFGLFLLLWTIIPLAANLRSCFHLIHTHIEPPSFWRKKVKDIAAVLGILIVFLLFTAAGFVLESVIKFLSSHLSILDMNIVGGLLSLLLTTFLIAGFYQLFSPVRIALPHLLFGAAITALLWMLMRPAFGLFLTLNKSYGAIFGGMKALFISITWLYFNFAVFLFGIELISTLRKKDLLLFKNLLKDNMHQSQYVQSLMTRYGKTYNVGDFIYREEDVHLNFYFVVDGTLHLTHHHQVIRILKNGDYFGEVGSIPSHHNGLSAEVVSPNTSIIQINAEYMQQLLQDDPNIAFGLIKKLTPRLQSTTT